MSRFLESIRFNGGRAWNVEYHEQRVARTLHAVYGRRPTWNFNHVITAAAIPDNGLLKCRLLYDIDSYALGFEPYTITTISTLKLVEANDIEYSHKYADRTVLNDLYKQRNGRDDILIVKNDRITDTSFANILLKDDKGTWFTPADCLLRGTMRQLLLDSGRIFEMSIGIGDLPRFSTFKVVNAMRDMSAGESGISNID